MNAAAYQDVLVRAHAMHQLAQGIGVEALEEAVRAADTAESIGPILQPTMFAQKARGLGEDREVLCAVRHLAALRVREGTAAS